MHIQTFRTLILWIDIRLEIYLYIIYIYIAKFRAIERTRKLASLAMIRIIN